MEQLTPRWPITRYATLTAQLKNEELSLEHLGLPSPAEFVTSDVNLEDRVDELQAALYKLQPVNFTRLAVMIERNDSMSDMLDGKEVRVHLL